MPVVRPERTLRDIHGQRDDRRGVSLRLARSTLKVGRDSLDFSVSTSHPGYLYLLYAGSDGRSFDMLFPNRLDGDNFIAASSVLSLPRAGWTVQARGPAGTNHLLAIVADAPRDFSRLGWQDSGAFSSLAATPGTARDVALTSATASAPPAGDCRPDAARPAAR